jgi:hypothetical protein
MSVSISGTAGVTFNDASVQNTAATGFGFKNRIINPAMVIDQRNAGASVTPTTDMNTLDRWRFGISQSSKFSTQQNAGSVTPPVGFTNYLGVTSLSSYSITSGDIFGLYQRIEGYNTADLAWGTANAEAITLSFQVYSSLTGTFGGSLQNNAGNRTYPFTYTISSANTWTSIAVTIPGDTTGTWLTNNGTGIKVTFGLGLGSSATAPAGSWTGTSGLWGANGCVSIVGTNGATFYITGVQLEKGSTATSFDYRPIGTELQLAQRYYQHINPTEIHYMSAGRYGANNIGFSIPTVVSLRGSPTVSSSGTFYVIGNGAQEAFTSPSLGAWSTSAVTLNKSSLTHNPSATQAYVVQIPGTGTNYVSFSSEL